MIGLTSSGVVVMPTWVFAFFLIGGIAIISYLLWACDISQQDLRHERRRRVVHDHLHHDGPPPASVFLQLNGDWTDEYSERVRDEIEARKGGAR